MTNSFIRCASLLCPTFAWAPNFVFCTNSRKCWGSTFTPEETRKLLTSNSICINSEYWHGKAVEIAISFLPSESPLVSHILMSYEKHHSPSN